jgi:predicted dehydrogenase
VLDYPGHRVLLHASKLAAAHGLRFAAHGTRGSWIKHGTDPQEAATLAGERPAGDWGHDPQAGAFTDAEGHSRAIENERGDYRLFWSALAASVRGEGPNPVPASEGLTVMEVLEAGLASARERRRVEL